VKRLSEKDMRVKSFFLSMGCWGVVWLSAATAWSHGVEGWVERAEAWCVAAQYDDGEPMGYAAVEIKSPGSETIFQSGRTDRNGRFLFKPDGPGQWRAVVSDGMGHQVSLDIAVEGGEAAAQTTEGVRSPVAAAEGANRPLKIIVGLSVIFGLCGVLYGWRARRTIAGIKVF
jgi:nickel transport protein